MHNIGLVAAALFLCPLSSLTVEMVSRETVSQYGEIPARCLRAGRPASYPGRLFLFQWITTAAFTYLEDVKLGARCYFY